jgi:subtilase family serine protease
MAGRRVRVVLASAAVVAGGLVPLVGAAPAGADGLFALTQNVLPGLAHATDLGAAPAAAPLHLVVSVARPDPAGEAAALAAVHNPASPSYRHFLTPAQFAAQFGVSASRRAALRSLFTGAGLQVESSSAAGDRWSLSGTAAQVSGLLHTSFRSYRVGTQSFVANTAAPVFPYGLGITNIVGLNTLQHYSTPARSHPAQDVCLGGTCLGATTPQDLWTTYQQPAAHTGQGQGLAVFGEGQTDGVISDLRQFESANGLPQIPVTVKRPAGDTDFSDDTGHVEWNIDTQASSGMAPDASNLTLYFGSDLSDADVDRVFSQFTDDADGPMQASASYGECETIPVVSDLVGQALSSLSAASLPIGLGLGNQNDATLAPIAQQAALEGKTIFVSSGDTGSSCPIVALPVIGAGNGVLNQVVPVTNSPASLPYVVAVGGTVLYTNGSGQRSREYGWAFSGGGSSLFTPAPAYQRGTAGLSLPCLTAAVPCRGVPDVAAQSGDVLTNGYGIVGNGAASQGGGTSLSSPLWEGMWARVQSASPNATGNGFANESFYRVGKNAASYARDFFDVSSTDLVTGLPATNGLYPTLPGWDYVTGWGTPRVNGLICDIDGVGC